jgi:hypothetical protein
MQLSLEIQGVSKKALQWYSMLLCGERLTKTIIFKGVQTIHRSAP